MADETLVLDGHSLADKRVRADLARRADGGVFLDFDKWANLRAGADGASVEIHELRMGDPHSVGQLHVFRDRHSDHLPFWRFGSTSVSESVTSLSLCAFQQLICVLECFHDREPLAAPHERPRSRGDALHEMFGLQAERFCVSKYWG